MLKKEQVVKARAAVQAALDAVNDCYENAFATWKRAKKAKGRTDPKAVKQSAVFEDLCHAMDRLDTVIETLESQ